MSPQALAIAFLCSAIALSARSQNPKNPDPQKHEKNDAQIAIEGIDKGATVPGVKDPNLPQSANDSNLHDCDYSEDSFHYQFKKIDMAPWSLFLNRQDVSNGFHLCLNGDETIFVQGVPAGGHAVRENGDNMLVETIQTNRFVSADDIVKGSIRGLKFGSGNSWADVVGRSVHYVSKSDLGHDGMKRLAAVGGNTVYAEKASWVRLSLDPTTKKATAMELHLRAIDGSKAAELVEKGFGLRAARKSSFNNADDRKRIEDFVKAEVGRFKGKGTSAPNPNVTVRLTANKGTAEIRAPQEVVSIVTNGDAAGRRLRDGDPDVRIFTHESLFWCFYPDPKTGKPRGFETFDEHRAHQR